MAVPHRRTAPHCYDDLAASTERDAAAGWLTDYLTLNPKSPSEDVKKAARAAGFSERTLQRARASLTVTTTEEGFPRRTFWSLP